MPVKLKIASDGKEPLSQRPTCQMLRYLDAMAAATAIKPFGKHIAAGKINQDCSSPGQHSKGRDLRSD